jgi:CheY-like chemotaxis protein
MQPLTLRVLLVDDDVDGAESMAALLQVLGHQAEVAHSGLDVLAIARRVVPDLVFMDVSLPGLSGLEVAKLIRQEPLLNHAQLVALTGWSGDAVKDETLRAGFDVFLLKPAGLDDLKRILDQIVRKVARI